MVNRSTLYYDNITFIQLYINTFTVSILLNGFKNIISKYKVMLLHILIVKCTIIY